MLKTAFKRVWTRIQNLSWTYVDVRGKATEGPSRLAIDKQAWAQANSSRFSRNWQAALSQWDYVLEHVPFDKNAGLGKAEILLETGRFDEASVLLHQFETQFPNDQEVSMHLVKLAMRTLQWNSALSQLASIIHQQSDYIPALSTKAHALRSIGRMDLAKDIFQHMQKTRKDKPAGLQGLAILEKNSVMQEYGLVLWKELIRRFPAYLPGFSGKADALTSIGKYALAAQIYHDLARRYPDRIDGMAGLANLAEKEENWQLAQSHWQSLCDRYPEDVTVHRGLARVLQKQGLLKDAELTLQKFSVSNFRHPAILGDWIRLANSIGDRKSLIEQIKAYVNENRGLCVKTTETNLLEMLLDDLVGSLIGAGEKDQTESLLWFLDEYCDGGMITIWRSRLLWQLGDQKAANQLCLDAVITHPDSGGTIHLQLARNAWAQADMQSTIRHCVNAIAQGQQFVKEASLLQYQALIRLKRVTEVVAILRNHLNDLPWHGSSCAALAEVLFFHEKKYLDVIEICEQTIDKGIHNLDVFAYLALAHSKTDNFPLAFKAVNQGLRISPANGQLMAVRSQLCHEQGNHGSAFKFFNEMLKLNDLEPLESNRNADQLCTWNLRCTVNDRFDCTSLVSVIMTTFGWNKHIPIAINSILQQTYRNIELIIVDDHSGDETYESLLNIANSDERVSIIPLPVNGGTYVAKNHGLQQAKGTYIAFMDSDDWCHPRSLERRVAALQEPDIIAVTCAFVRINSSGDIEFKPEPAAVQAPISLCFKRDIVLNRIGYFDPVRIAGDSEYIQRLLAAFGHRVLRQLPAPMLIAYRHDSSITGGGPLQHAWYGAIPEVDQYKAAFKSWHGRISMGEEDAMLVHPLKSRRFDAPECLLS